MPVVSTSLLVEAGDVAFLNLSPKTPKRPQGGAHPQPRRAGSGPSAAQHGHRQRQPAQLGAGR
jgi:hypothetical protein